MSSFTYVDVAAAVIIVISAILAYSRGFVREATAIAGWILAAVLAFVFAPAARPLVAEIPYIDTYLATSCELSIIVAAFAVFAVALLAVSIFTPLLSDAVRDTALGPVDQTAGFIFGVARGVILVAVAFVAYDRIAATGTLAAVDDSRTARIFARSEPALEGALPTDAPGWIVTRYEGLVGVCG